MPRRRLGHHEPNLVTKKKVRDENKGTPRSSYELSVINQFYTPSSKQVAEDEVRKWLWTIGPPKSAKSVRRVALTDDALAYLNRLKESADDPSGLISAARTGP